MTMTTYPTFPSNLTQDDLAQFHKNGYLAFENFLDTERLGNITDTMNRLVEEMVEDARDNKCNIISRQHPEENGERVTLEREGNEFQIQFEAGIDPLTKPINDLVRLFRKFHMFTGASPLFQNLADDPKLTGVLKQLMGEDIIQFGSMALSKPAKIGVEKPWHQDNAYFKYGPLNKVLGVWIALEDVTVENGCMHFIPGSHQDGCYKHVHKLDCEIDVADIDMSKVEPVELSAGGIIIFYGMTLHQTPPNRSDRDRRSIQIHYRGESTVEYEPDDYGKNLFITPQGEPASCKFAPTVS